MNLLSTARDGDLDRVTRTAQRVIETETALISLVDGDRGWFKSRQGFNLTETPRNISFCGHTIVHDEPFVVTDTALDDRFHDNPLVTGGPKIRFYAGQSLKNNDGFKIGTLCVMSTQPRDFSNQDSETLKDLARMAEVILDNRRLDEAQAALLSSLVMSQREKMVDPLSGLWNRRGLDVFFDREISRAIREVTPLVIGMIDLDHFKKINDKFGHSIGDEAIKLTGELLSRMARSTDVVARVGGEEFVLLAPKALPGSVSTLGHKILSAFHSYAHLDTNDGPCIFTASIGLTIAQPKVNSPGLAKALIAEADKAMYEAKKAGRDRFCLAPAVAMELAGHD
jgi:diguanylate cyclase (GGDEF)-like protein